MALYPNTSTKQIINTEIKKKINTLGNRIETVNEIAEQAQSTANSASNSVSDLATVVDGKQTQIDTINDTLETVQSTLSEKQDTLTFDNEPLVNSDNPVKSSGIYAELDKKLDKDSVKFNPEPNGSDALSTGGAYDIVQDLSEQIHDVKNATVLQSTDEKQFINEGSIVIDNSQEEVTNAIEVLNGDTKLKDTDVDGVLRTDEINSLSNNGVTFEDTINAQGINATEYKGQLEHKVSFVDKNGTTTDFDNNSDVTVDSIESAKNDINGEQIDLTYIKNSEKGIANGVATLDTNGKIPTSQLPMEALVYCGEWDASTGVFPTVGSGEEGTLISGDFYNVAVGGTIDGVDYEVNDWIIYKIINNVGSWTLKENTNDVHSVNGKTGVVVLTPSDIGISII